MRFIYKIFTQVIYTVQDSSNNQLKRLNNKLQEIYKKVETIYSTSQYYKYTKERKQKFCVNNFFISLQEENRETYFQIKIVIINLDRFEFYIILKLLTSQTTRGFLQSHIQRNNRFKIIKSTKEVDVQRKSSKNIVLH